MKKITAVVTDSTCDLPESMVQESDIHVVPVLINIENQTLRDGVDITREQFYEWLPRMRTPPTTSAPSPGAFVELYAKLLEDASHIVSIHTSSRLSGIYNAASVAAQQVAADRIRLVDSGQTSMGLGWAVLSAAEAAQKGGTIESVLHSTWDTLRRMRLYAILPSLEYLARSGRVNLVRAGLSTLLNIKPMVELREGVVSTLGRIRTWTGAVSALAERVQRIAPIERLSVMHSDYAEAAHEFLNRVMESLPLPKPRTLITNVTTVIGAHVGPHGLGIAAVVSKEG
jgi:DegV family protein with EDD domain